MKKPKIKNKNHKTAKLKIKNDIILLFFLHKNFLLFIAITFLKFFSFFLNILKIFSLFVDFSRFTFFFVCLRKMKNDIKWILHFLFVQENLCIWIAYILLLYKEYHLFLKWINLGFFCFFLIYIEYFLP